MPGMLLKLLVKDKLLHNRKVSVNAKERHPNPLRRLVAETPEESDTR